MALHINTVSRAQIMSLLPSRMETLSSTMGNRDESSGGKPPGMAEAVFKRCAFMPLGAGRRGVTICGCAVICFTVFLALVALAASCRCYQYPQGIGDSIFCPPWIDDDQPASRLSVPNEDFRYFTPDRKTINKTREQYTFLKDRLTISLIVPVLRSWPGHPAQF